MSQPFYNFSAGPAVLPAEVLKQAKSELLDWQGSGISVMEMSHRGECFSRIAAQAEADLRALLDIPESYRVLFLQGGASSQFAMVPMNLLGTHHKADYICTGAWSKKAIAEAKRYCQVHIAASSEKQNFTTIPDPKDWSLDDGAAYVHYTPNETIGGVEFHSIPKTGSVPLVADMSSTLLSRPIKVEQLALIYAGAQKNIGPAGLTLVIVREDVVAKPLQGTPAMFTYGNMIKSGSMYNTPPTFSWYLAGLVFGWLKDRGGLQGMAKINQRKSKKLYQAINGSDFYNCPVDMAHRSWMNIPFTLAEDGLDSVFLAKAKEVGLLSLKGHRSVGGMRASLYNAMPEAGVDALVNFMNDFEQHHA